MTLFLHSFRGTYSEFLAQILALCAVWYTRLWSMSHRVPREVAGPPSVGAAPIPPAAVIALPPALPATVLAPPIGTEGGVLAQIVAHLEFFNYAVRHDPDGWHYAQHPGRHYNFHFRVFTRSIRLHCRVGIGASSRAAWLLFLNDANNRSAVTSFGLVEEADGTYVRMKGMVAGAYDRSVFAMVMDMWHDDLDIVMRKPDFVKQSSTDGVQETALVSATVH